MSFAQQVPEVDDRQRLGVFVWMLYEDLDSVVAVRRELFDGGGYLDFIEVLPRAWEEAGAARQRVLDEVVAADQEALEVAGLTDSSLLAKLEAWNSARDRMLDEFDVGGPEDLPPPGVPSPPSRPRGVSVGSPAGYVVAGRCVASERCSGSHGPWRTPTTFSTA